MDTPTFNSLKFGNLISGPGGQTFIVQHTKTDLAGRTIAIGVLPAYQVEQAAGLTLVDASYSQTLLMGNTVQPK